MVRQLLLECLDLVLERGLVLGLQLTNGVLVGYTELLDGGLRLGTKLLKVLAVDIAGLVLRGVSIADDT